MNVIANGSGVKDGKVIKVHVVEVQVEHWEDVKARVDAIAEDRGCQVQQLASTRDEEDVPQVGKYVPAFAFPLPRGELFGYFTRRACGSDPVCVQGVRDAKDADFCITGGTAKDRLAVFNEIGYAVEGGEYYAMSPGQCGSCGSERETMLTGVMNGAFKVDSGGALNLHTLNMWELEAQVAGEAELASLTLTKEEWVR